MSVWDEIEKILLKAEALDITIDGEYKAYAALLTQVDMLLEKNNLHYEDYELFLHRRTLEKNIQEQNAIFELEKQKQNHNLHTLFDENQNHNQKPSKNLNWEDSNNNTENKNQISLDELFD